MDAELQDDRPYQQRATALPRDVDAVTPAWLTGTLAQRYPGLVVRDMEVVELRNGHTTKMRVRLDLNEAGRASGVPSQVCLKSNWSGGFANVDIHALEARFYHQIRDAMRIPAPVTYFEDWDSTPLPQGLVVMEDLVAGGGTFGHSLDHIGVDAVAAGLEDYASIHGRSWGDRRLDGFAWLQTSMDTPVDSDQLRMMWPYAQINIAKPHYQALLPRWLLDDPQAFHRLYDALGAYERAQPGPFSVVHGDSHQGNSYTRPSGERIRIDWQLVRRGRPWRDITYFMIGSLTIEERRANERRLVEHYREHLAAIAGDTVPDAEAIWDAYRRWPVYGCQAWIANMDEWGQDGYPMNERFFTALDDLDTASLLLG